MKNTPQKNPEFSKSSLAYTAAVLLFVFALIIQPIAGLLFSAAFISLFAGLTFTVSEDSERVVEQRKLEVSIKAKSIIRLTQLKQEFNDTLAKEVLDDLRKVRPGFDSQQFYSLALDLVITHKGNQNVKVFALDLGRWHYSLQRPDKKPTIYDEQAIQNDITTRS